MVDIRITGTADLMQMRAQFKAMQKEVAKLNAELEATAIVPGRVNPAGYAQMQRQVAKSSETWRNAAASSGQFTTQQLRLNSATEQYTELLKRQKLSMRDLVKNRNVMKQAYVEQIRLQNMVVRENPIGAGGKRTYDIAVPTNVSKQLDTVGAKLGWIRAQTASASRMMVNWGKNTQWAGRQLMVGFTMPVAAFGAATGVMAYNVDKELTRIVKVYDTTAIAIKGDAKSMAAVETELARVRVASLKTATDAAREYGAAATDTLKVQADLAATGLKGNSLQQSTSQVMRISTLGELDTTQATETAIALQTAFKLSTNQLTEAFNFMNATENATSLSIQDIAEATPRAASAMSELGVSVKQMTVMLTSMKESGVDAAEAANALKSATGTILAPSPAADDFIKQISDGKVQVMDLAEASNGNLYVAMQKLYEQMDGLNSLQKQQILVKLFGKYQFNRISAMLYNMGDAFDGVQNQTSKAMSLMSKDSSDLAFIADQELKRFQESASGKFKRSLESIKIQLAEMGKPFLTVAADVMGVLESLISKFNSLPDGLKKFAAGGAIIMAALGPVIMLLGLFANFVGNLGLAGATILGLVSKFNILNKEEWATQKVSELARVGFVRQATAVELLNKQINALTLSAQEARLAIGNLSSTPPGPVNLGMPPVLTPPGTNASHPITPGGQALVNLTGLTTQTNPAMAQSARASDLKLQAESAQKAAASQREMLNSQLAASIAARDQVKSENTMNAAREKGKGLINGAAVGTATMGASMALMMATSNTIANDIGKWLMIATIAVPAAKALATTSGLIAARMTEAAAAAWAETAAVTASAGAGNKLAGSASLMKSGIAGAASGFSAMMGPVGWTVAAVSAIGIGLYAWEKRQRAIYDAQVETQKALSSSTEDWANQAGEVVRQFERIQQASVLGNYSGKSTFEQRVALYQGDEMKKSTEGYADLSVDNQKNFMLQRYIDLQNRSGLSARAAAEEVKAMMVAAGQSYNEADLAASELYKTIGLITDSDLSIAVDANIELLNYDNVDTMKTSAEDLADVWGEAFRKSNSPEEAQALMDKLTNISKEAYDNIFNNMLSDHGRKEFYDAGVSDLKSYFSAIQSGDLALGTWSGANGYDYNEIMQAAQAAGMMEYDITKAISSSQHLGDNYKFINDMFTDIALKSKTMTYEEAVRNSQEVLKNLQEGVGVQTISKHFLGISAEEAEREAQGRALIALNIVNANQGIKEGKTPAAAMYNLTHHIMKETAGAANEAKNLSDNLKGIPNYLNIAFTFTGENYKSMLQTGMEGVQSSISDLATTQFDTNMNSAIDSAQKGWDRRIAGQEAAQQNAQDAFDKRWERKTDAVTKYYDDRIKKNDEAIKAEQKAEEIRQAIFDAEMQRIERMNAIANQNIDFNVALNSGDFDEAAKLRNDMQAQADNWTLQDAKDHGSKKSENRVNRLEDKKDNISEQKDKALKALKDQEDAERKHLEKVQQMRSNALKAQSDAEMAAMKERYDADKATLEERLTLFKSYTARNQKDLDRWMKVVGLSYDDFGIDVKDKGSAWSTYFRTELAKNVRLAGTEIANDTMWKEIGNKVAKDMLGGALDMSWGQFTKWMKTGEFETGGYKPSRADYTGNDNVRSPNNGGMGPQIHHVGGVVGESRGSRKGVARSMKGLHSSERMVLAQKGEFIVNRRASAENAGVLHAMNSGRLNVGDGVGGAGSPGITGAMAAIVGTAIRQAISRGIKTSVDNKKAEMAAPSASTSGLIYGPGTAGMYSDRSFSIDQLRNAATIASVGADMGMSKRDIEIGIMTAITESGLTNVQYGDRDSLGLFQQRPSQGWGTPAQVTDPVYASRKFFSVLKGIVGRGTMSPWAAAQAVQRSAYSDGSNYEQYWDNAEAIYNNGLSKNGNAYTAITSSVTPGGGGWRKPSVPGKGWANTHDYRNGLGSPLYAYNDGVVTDSRAITSGGSPGNGLYSTPYRSYGETIAIRGADGNVVRYAHLSPGKRFVRAGQSVKGGTLIGLSGQTGNATGPHTHFDVNGSYNASSFFASHGIGLKSGGLTKTDGMANLHKKEVVVDPGRTKDLFKSLDQFAFVMSGLNKLPNIDNRPMSTNIARNFANEGNSEYNVKVNLYGTDISVEDVTQAVRKAIKKDDARKPGSRTS